MKIIFIPFIAVASLAELGAVINQHQQPGDIAATVTLPAYTPADSASRINGQWFLLAELPSDTASGKLANISFDIKKGSFTGNTGCKFALSNTKGTAMAIADWVEPRVVLDSPVNIHLTGCPNSCAQHYIGDIGMIACRVPIDDAGEDTVEGFHVFVGGGFGADAGIGRELYRDVKVEDCPRLVERILRAYVTHRAGSDETFLVFTRRHEIGALKSMVEASLREAA